MLGGGIQGRYDLDSGRTAMDFHALAKGAAAAGELIPSVAGVRITRCWSGIEGKTEDLLPVISFNAKTSAEDQKKHEDFVNRMMEKGYTQKGKGKQKDKGNT